MERTFACLPIGTGREETLDTIALPPLTLGRYRVELTLEEPADLPAYLGGVLRGGFGAIFKRLVCMQPHLERCDDCVLLHNCAYPAVFRPSPPPDAEVLSTHQRIPAPYILEPPARREVPWTPGETLPFDLHLIGDGTTYLPYFVLAFQRLGRQGLGRRRRQAVLSQVMAVEANGNEQTSLWKAENLRHDWKTRGLWHAQELPALSETGSSPTLRFLTPTRLKYQGEYVEETPPFHVVFRTLLRRISSFSYFYAGQQWDIDYRGWIDRAKHVEIVDADTQWQDWERYSTRQRRRMNLGGIVGTVTYTGNLTPFLPVIQLGELIHVGKGTTFGNGRYGIVD